MNAPAPRIEVLPEIDRVAGVDEIVAWHVVRYRWHQKYWTAGDALGTFDNETEAIDFAAEMRRQEAAP